VYEKREVCGLPWHRRPRHGRHCAGDARRLGPTRACDQPHRAVDVRGGTTAPRYVSQVPHRHERTPMPSFLGAPPSRSLQLAVSVKSLGRQPLWDMRVRKSPRSIATGNRTPKRCRPAWRVPRRRCRGARLPFAVRDDNTMIDRFKYAEARHSSHPSDVRVVQPDVRHGNRLGSWTDDQIKTFVTRGVRQRRRRMMPYPMPWPNSRT